MVEVQSAEAGPAEVAELGWEEARDGLVLVEWPERLGALRPAEALLVQLAQGATEEERVATLSGWTDRVAGIGG